MEQKPLKLGKVQLEIMKVLWRNGSATARDISEALAPTEGLSHSTVQTLLRKLEAKGAVTHELEERTFIFKPLYQKDEVTETATRDLLTRVFQGSVYGMVSHLLKHEEISEDELNRIKKLIEKEK